ncbi:MAG: DUF3467 domain-containing protein [Candidatus Riflebacteria bacterium]|nr:DUF3467 domain-containing protein [Candidatus Riflebacteria bacterium]
MDKKKSIVDTEATVETDVNVTAKDGTQVKVNWDASKMRSSYANVCNVSSTREEVILMFGTNQSWHAGNRELTVELTDRLVLNPFAAKRLSIVLTNVIQAYEDRFGHLPLEEGKK